MQTPVYSFIQINHRRKKSLIHPSSSSTSLPCRAKQGKGLSDWMTVKLVTDRRKWEATVVREHCGSQHSAHVTVVSWKEVSKIRRNHTEPFSLAWSRLLLPIHLSHMNWSDPAWALRRPERTCTEDCFRHKCAHATNFSSELQDYREQCENICHLSVSLSSWRYCFLWWILWFK